MQNEKFWEFFTRNQYDCTYTLLQMHAQNVNKNTLSHSLRWARESERFSKKNVLTITKDVVIIILLFRIVMSLYFNSFNSVACMCCVCNLDISHLFEYELYRFFCFCTAFKWLTFVCMCEFIMWFLFVSVCVFCLSLHII